MARLDAVVLGAGPAGSAVALGMARRGLRVALLERKDQPALKMGESLRGLAQEPLKELGLWQDFLRQGHLPGHLSRALWAGQDAEKDTTFRPFGVDYHLDRPRFDAWLLAHARDAGVEMMTSARVSALARASPNGFTLTGTSAERAWQLQAPVVIDATGRSAWAMRQLGARRTRIDRLVGHTRWFDARDASREVLVEAAAHGWWYSAPLPGSRLVAVYFTDADAATQPSWSQALGSAPHTRARLGGAPSHERATFLASPQLTEYDPALRCWPVGDAAFCVDPLSATGLWFALASAHDVAKAVTLELGGGHELRRNYQRSLRRSFQLHLAMRSERYAAQAGHQPTTFWRRNRGLERSDGAFATAG